MKANEFIQGINDLKSKISNNPIFEVIEWKVNPGISIESVREIEQHGGFTLPDELKALHQFADGMTLKWKIKEDATEDELIRFFEGRNTFDIDIEYYQQDPLGCIQLNPIHYTFIEQTGEMWQLKKDETLLFAGVTYSFNEFCSYLKFYDMYSDFEGVAFLRQNNRFDQLLILTGHYDDWYSSKLISFSNYLQLLLLTGGIVEARGEMLYDTQDKRKPLPIFEKFDDELVNKFKSLLS